jgi:hypothetical protein
MPFDGTERRSSHSEVLEAFDSAIAAAQGAAAE